MARRDGSTSLPLAGPPANLTSTRSRPIGGRSPIVAISNTVTAVGATVHVGPRINDTFRGAPGRAQ